MRGLTFCECGVVYHSTTFGNFNPKSDLDVIIANAKDLPGPADYAAEIPPVTKPTIKSLKKKLQKAGKT